MRGNLGRDWAAASSFLGSRGALAALIGVFLLASASCAELGDSAGAADSVSDSAGLALTTAEAAAVAPTIKILSPAAVSSAVPPFSVTMDVAVTNFALGTDGQIAWYMDTTKVATSTATSYTYLVQAGVHTLGVRLVDLDGVPVNAATTSAHVFVQGSNPCTSIADCDPVHPCYITACNGSAGGKVCKYGPSAGSLDCCQSDFECTWPLTCATAGPNAGTCIQCMTDADCDDSGSCTTDVCNPDGTCSHVKADPSCCDWDSACDDGQMCTTDTCDLSTHACSHSLKPGMCCQLGDCPVGPCKQVACTSHECRYGPIPNCCTKDADCDDKNECTINTCDVALMKCDFSQKVTKWCCVSDADCDDANPLTEDLCFESVCIHNPNGKQACTPETFESDCTNGKTACNTAACGEDGLCAYVPVDGCCLADGDCDDGKACTKDTCATATSTCYYSVKPGFCCQVVDCPPKDECSIEACIANECRYGPGTGLPGCCTDAGDCGDGNACTLDSCVANKCVHTPTPEEPWCCEMDADCADDDPCTDTWCFEGECGVSMKCDPVSPYKEPFVVAPGQGYSSLGFHVEELGQAPQIEHWSLATAPGGVFGTGSMLRFNGGGGLTDLDLESCAVSPVINSGTTTTLQIGWKGWFDHGSGAAPVALRVELAKDGDWAAAQMVWSAVATTDIAGASYQVQIAAPSPFLGGKKVALRFCVKTANTYGAWSWYVDDVFVIPGKPPAFLGSTFPQTVTAGQKKLVPLKAKDPDNDPLTFEIVDGPYWVTLTAPYWYPPDSSWNATVTLAPPGPSVAGVWPVSVRVNDGALFDEFAFDVVVRHDGGALIWAPAGVTAGAAEAIKKSLVTLGKQAQIQHSLSVYPDLSVFEAVFVTLGAWPHTAGLNPTEADRLVGYLGAGGRLYLEGGDAFTDPPTALHPLLHATASSDGGPVQTLEGLSTLAGKSWGFTESPILNSSVDQLDAEPSAGTFAVLRNQGAEVYDTVVAHDDPGGHRTLASSVLFAGVLDGASTRLELMAAWLGFFESGP